MNIIEFKDKLLGIQPALNSLMFLYDRVLKNDYRGIHKLQHYRWDKEFIKIILKHLPRDEYLYHTKGDISNDYHYSDEEYEFCQYLDRVNKDLNKIGKSVSDNGVRKIIFVNLQRMGFVDRFTSKKKLCNINKKSKYRYVRISQKGLNFLNSKDIFEEQKHLGTALDFVFDGIVQDILDILNSLKHPYLTITEMMFFVTYLHKSWNGIILNKDKIVEFINEFRNLNSRAKIVEQVINEYCIPEHFSGNKNDKRDFHNWKNQAQTMFDSLSLMSLFEYDSQTERLLLKTKLNGEKIEFKRSSLIKKEYFLNHEIEKDITFELHHIVPFYYAKDIDALKAIDNWQNLIYIDANSHKIFTLDKNAKKAIRINFKELDAVLDNLIGDEVVLKYTTQIKYKQELQDRLVSYNKSLLGL